VVGLRQRFGRRCVCRGMQLLDHELSAVDPISIRRRGSISAPLSILKRFSIPVSGGSSFTKRFRSGINRNIPRPFPVA
ncbi:MAG: hypothetical protein Q4E13_12405, partial [Clostridia bacterium]|nr:hypothetical protein [Clostridia bacterium]